MYLYVDIDLCMCIYNTHIYTHTHFQKKRNTRENESARPVPEGLEVSAERRGVESRTQEGDGLAPSKGDGCGCVGVGGLGFRIYGFRLLL